MSFKYSLHATEASCSDFKTVLQKKSLWMWFSTFGRKKTWSNQISIPVSFLFHDIGRELRNVISARRCDQKLMYLMARLCGWDNCVLYVQNRPWNFGDRGYKWFNKDFINLETEIFVLYKFRDLFIYDLKKFKRHENSFHPAWYKAGSDYRRCLKLKMFL